MGLTTALKRRDWHLVGVITQTLQDCYGSMTEEDVLTLANVEATRLAMSRVVHQSTPIEA